MPYLTLKKIIYNIKIKGKKNLDKDKWLSIKKIHFFPVKQILFLGPIRIIVDAVLLILTLFTILLFP